jgi:hypothetical protein
MKRLFSQRKAWALAATVAATTWMGSASYGQVESLNPNPLQPAGIGGSSSIGTYHSGSEMIQGSGRGTRRTPGLPALPSEQNFYRGGLPLRSGEEHPLYFAKRGAYEDMIYHPRRGSYRNDVRTTRTSNYRGRVQSTRSRNYRGQVRSTPSGGY